MGNETTHAEPAPVTPATYEMFPAWLSEEVAQGSTLELRAKLRKALCKAIATSQGVLKQEGWNPEQRYTYTGHAEVMAACRQAMAENGLSIDQPLIEREAIIGVMTKNGEMQRWAWRVVCLVTHEDGGVLVRVVRPITMANDKASFVARTAADRVVMMNVMRIAGSKEDPEAENEAGETPRSAPKAEEPRRAPSTPQTQAKPAAAAPKAGSVASSAAATPSSARPQTQPGSSSTAAASKADGELPKAERGLSPKQSTGSDAPPTTGSSVSTTAPSSPSSGQSSSATPSGETPLTDEQRKNIYSQLAAAGVAAPRAGSYLSSLMNRLGMTGKVTGENYALVIGEIAKEASAAAAP